MIWRARAAQSARPDHTPYICSSAIAICKALRDDRAADGAAMQMSGNILSR